MSFYPDVQIAEDGITIGEQTIPEQFLAGPPKIQAESGHFHRVTLTVWADSITLGPGIVFDGAEHE